MAVNCQVTPAVALSELGEAAMDVSAGVTEQLVSGTTMPASSKAPKNKRSRIKISWRFRPSGPHVPWSSATRLSQYRQVKVKSLPACSPKNHCELLDGLIGRAFS